MRVAGAPWTVKRAGPPMGKSPISRGTTQQGEQSVVRAVFTISRTPQYPSPPISPAQNVLQKPDATPAAAEPPLSPVSHYIFTNDSAHNPVARYRKTTCQSQ